MLRPLSGTTSTHGPMQQRTVNALLSVLTVMTGVVLLMYMIYVEGEPGAIPILLVVLGIGWSVITRLRR